MIRVHAVGVSASQKDSVIHLAADSSSTFRSDGESKPISLIDASELCNHCGHNRIDLIKINIEGEEYDVLDRLIEVGLIRSFRNIQVQFHDFVPDAVERMKAIQNKLRLSHRITYQYEFVWENWEAVAWPPQNHSYTAGRADQRTAISHEREFGLDSLTFPATDQK
jgi:hypothetical protein